MRATMSKPNRKLLQSRADGYSALRVFARKGRGKRSPRLLIKCGDCDNALEIYYDPKDPEDIEIGGVLASTANWREILRPMLDAAASLHFRKPRQRNRPRSTKQ